MHCFPQFTSPRCIDPHITIWLLLLILSLLLFIINPLYVFGAPLLSPCIPASLPSSLPPGSASPSPTRWPSLRVKAVFPAPLARQNVAVAEPVRTDRRQSRHTGEKHVHTRGKIFFLLRQSDFGKSRPAVLSRRAGMSNVSTCEFVFFCLFSRLVSLQLSSPRWLQWGN